MVVVDNSNKYIQALVTDARVARLATIDFEEAKPHIVPVVFVFDGNSYYIPIDKKPKRDNDPERLRRVRNIQENPNVALLIDEYSEDWSKLFFVMIQGKGSLIGKFSGYNYVKKVGSTELDGKPEQLHPHRQERDSSSEQVSIHAKKCSKLVVRKISTIPENRFRPAMHNDISRKDIYMEDE